MLQGYWNRPEATEEAFRGGWFHTGDMAKRDDEGFFYIVDRKKDMIITGGENVYSREVEEVLYAHPAVSEAAVIGLPDATWGERVTAVVTLRAGASRRRRQEIMARLPRPPGRVQDARRTVLFVDELPEERQRQDPQARAARAVRAGQRGPSTPQSARRWLIAVW